MRRLTKEQKIMQGTYQACRDKQVKPLVQLTDIPPAPDSLPPEAVEIWNSVCEQLKERKDLATVYIPSIEVYAFAAYMVQVASKRLQTEGYTTEYTNKAGATNKSPSEWFKIWKDSSATMLSLSGKLGVTPLDKGKLPEVSIEDNVSSLIKGEDSLFR